MGYKDRLSEILIIPSVLYMIYHVSVIIHIRYMILDHFKQFSGPKIRLNIRDLWPKTGQNFQNFGPNWG